MSRMIVDVHGDIEGDFEIIAPYVEREKVHGEWIYNKTSTLWECSNCHEEEIRSTTYCPHCGARNRGGR